MASPITQPISTIVSSVSSFVVSWSSYIYERFWSRQPNIAEVQKTERDVADGTAQLESLVSSSGQTDQLNKDRVDDKARNALHLQHSSRPLIVDATGEDLKRQREQLNKALLAINSDPVTPAVTVNPPSHPTTVAAADPLEEAKRLVKEARDLAALVKTKFEEKELSGLAKLESCATFLDTEAKPGGNAQKRNALKGQLAEKILALTDEYERALQTHNHILNLCQTGLDEVYSRFKPLSKDSDLKKTGFNPNDVEQRIDSLGVELGLYRRGQSKIQFSETSNLLQRIEKLLAELKKLSKTDASESAFDDIASYANGRTRNLGSGSGGTWQATIRIDPNAWAQILGGDGNAQQILGILRDEPVIILKDGTQKGQRAIKPEPYGWIFSTSSNLRLCAKLTNWPPKALTFDYTHRAEH